MLSSKEKQDYIKICYQLFNRPHIKSIISKLNKVPVKVPISVLEMGNKKYEGRTLKPLVKSSSNQI